MIAHGPSPRSFLLKEGVVVVWGGASNDRTRHKHGTVRYATVKSWRSFLVTSKATTTLLPSMIKHCAHSVSSMPYVSGRNRSRIASFPSDCNNTKHVPCRQMPTPRRSCHISQAQPTYTYIYIRYDFTRGTDVIVASRCV